MFPVQPTLSLIVNLILYLDFWASLSHFLVKCKHRGWGSTAILFTTHAKVRENLIPSHYSFTSNGMRGTSFRRDKFPFSPFF